MKPIAFDIDGVLAAFTTGHVQRIVRLTVKDLFRDGKAGLGEAFPNVWDYPQAAGYTKEEDSMVWQDIFKDALFWYNLPMIAGADLALKRLNDLRNAGENVYFITNRAGIEAKLQTEGWLRKRGFFNPTVLLTADKAAAVRCLGVGSYIDDRLLNCNEVKEACPEVRVYLKAAPYNDRPVAAAGPVTGENCRDPRLIVVGSVGEMLEREGL